MYAIVKTGGKQYRVAPQDVIEVEKLKGEPGATVVLDQVLMVATDSGLHVGTPFVDGASVACELVEQKRGPKIIIFKKKRRKHYRRKKGHRQHYTVLRVLEILTDGKKPSVSPKKAASGKKDAEKAKADAAAAKDKPASKEAAKAEGGDDLSLLSGVGPVLEKKLREAGITTFKQIAELTPEQAKELDEKLKLGGRIEREEWIEQAKELMAGKAPRAKVDQKKAAKKDS
ncbi:50S ribosomal protein L21 [Thermopetrobacter sp. TC1]|uniref:50S ribosomal protein L21 n=1 Tax=Thermopetrobacter sp. TC1 TaxID=1495045 RepID=UPI00056F0417|nr:50S ribosomal protein L21 [Thermopetrobacter sp. TC1]